jgi:hypothetical protein
MWFSGTIFAHKLLKTAAQGGGLTGAQKMR